MNSFFNVAAVVVVGLLVLAGYWYMNPTEVPLFLRGENMPHLEIRKPASPMSHFRAPRFGG
jgi:hypothetical protein